MEGRAVEEVAAPSRNAHRSEVAFSCSPHQLPRSEITPTRRRRTASLGLVRRRTQPLPKPRKVVPNLDDFAPEGLVPRASRAWRREVLAAYGDEAELLVRGIRLGFGARKEEDLEAVGELEGSEGEGARGGPSDVVKRMSLVELHFGAVEEVDCDSSVGELEWTLEAKGSTHCGLPRGFLRELNMSKDSLAEDRKGTHRTCAPHPSP